MGRDRLCYLRNFTVDSCPALVTLTGELLLHVQDIVVVEVAADVEAWSTDAVVEADVEEARVEVQVGPRLQALTDAFAVLLAQGLTAQLSG